MNRMWTSQELEKAFHLHAGMVMAYPRIPEQPVSAPGA